MFLSIDLGSTHAKAGLFSGKGELVAVAKAPTPRSRWRNATVIDPEELWQAVAGLIREVAERAGRPALAAVAVAGMVESGLFLDERDGSPRTPILPWFDASSQPQAEQLRRIADPEERFAVTGLHPSYKLGAAKWLWLRSVEPDAAKGGVWVSALSYLAYRLTGQLSEEYTLAARTYAFRIDRAEWDGAFLRELGLPPSAVPDPHPADASAGKSRNCGAIGVPDGTDVFVAGHDHVAASLAAGALGAAAAFNSMGTAEVLLGTFPRRRLTPSDYRSGLSFGLHHAPGTYFWMGGHSSSGGSVEWLRRIIGEGPSFGYAEMLDLLAGTEEKPTGIAFLPYLSGRGAPDPKPDARAAFIGLADGHGKGDLLRAVLEGNAYQMEWIRAAAEKTAGARLSKLAVAGGGTRNPYWLQIKADVSGLELIAPESEESALRGAAIIAAGGLGLDGSGLAAAPIGSVRVYRPHGDRHAAYREWYRRSFLPLARACAQDKT